MANINRETLLSKVFTDPKHYPYGFARSGDFSINESKALGQYGALIAALVDGHIAPDSDEDRGFLAAAFEQKQPESAAEKAWVKYQKRINRPKLGNIYGGRPVDVVEGDDSAVASDTGIEIDTED